MTITSFGNLAIKVADLDAAVQFFERAGAPVSGRALWRGSERAEVDLGGVQLTLFTRAIYEDNIELPEAAFLHLAVFTDDLDTQLAGQEVLWGPAELSGSFGTRRVAFVTAPGNVRMEFMEQLEPPR